MPLLTRILFVFDLLIAAVILYFFAVGLGDGSVSAFNAELWAALLIVVATVLGGGFALHRKGFRRTANLLLAVLAAPGLLYGLFILLIVVTQPNWH